jgi:nitroreductase
MYTHNLMVNLLAHGIGGCPQTIPGYNVRVVREQLNMAGNQNLLFGISFGHEDLSSPANQIQPASASLTESV